MSESNPITVKFISDGVGDLNGITDKLPYLKDIGMTGIWLSPIYESPMVDFGYDISNYTAIHYEFGTIQDFENLVKRCKLLGIKLILGKIRKFSKEFYDETKLSIFVRFRA